MFSPRTLIKIKKYYIKTKGSFKQNNTIKSSLINRIYEHNKINI